MILSRYHTLPDARAALKRFEAVAQGTGEKSDYYGLIEHRSDDCLGFALKLFP
jgi:hypothetical protein